MSIFKGNVIEGSQRAGFLGYPTVNIPLSDESISGIYIGEVTALGNKYPAAIFADGKRKILEAYLLDFSGDLYGKEITIELFEKIRENETFENDTALQKAIASDVALVREYFKKH
jgi:riboflavin kinase/FMN adenylyltransferase